MATAEGTKNMEIYEKDLPDTEISKKNNSMAWHMDLEQSTPVD